MSNSHIVTQITRPNGAVTVDYLPSGLIGQIQYLNSGSQVQDVEVLSDDLRGNYTRKSTLSDLRRYSYDPNGQLVGATSLNFPAETYSYDSVGNRLTDAQGHSYSYDSKAVRLSDDGVYSYAYDNYGNVLSKTNHDSTKAAYQFSYNSKNQVTQVQILSTATGPVRGTLNYQYDAIGRRMQKSYTDNINFQNSYTRMYLYDGQNLLAELDGNGQLLAKYTFSPNDLDNVLAVNITTDGARAGMATNSGNYYYNTDHQRSIASISDSQGKIIQKYNYQSFGKIISITDNYNDDVSAAQPVYTSLTYTGREYEEETGLYYYRARYYDPATGRFLQQDPDPGFFNSPITIVNRYTYAGNSPTMFTDPTGRLFGIDDWLAIIAITAIATSIENQHQGGNYLGQFVVNLGITTAAVYTGGAAGEAAGNWGAYQASLYAPAYASAAGAASGAAAGYLVGSEVGSVTGAGLGWTLAAMTGQDARQGFLQGAEEGYYLGGIAGGAAGADKFIAGGGNKFSSSNAVSTFVYSKVNEIVLNSLALYATGAVYLATPRSP